MGLMHGASAALRPCLPTCLSNSAGFKKVVIATMSQCVDHALINFVVWDPNSFFTVKEASFVFIIDAICLCKLLEFMLYDGWLSYTWTIPGGER